MGLRVSEPSPKRDSGQPLIEVKLTNILGDEEGVRQRVSNRNWEDEGGEYDMCNKTHICVSSSYIRTGMQQNKHTCARRSTQAQVRIYEPASAWMWLVYTNRNATKDAC